MSPFAVLLQVPMKCFQLCCCMKDLRASYSCPSLIFNPYEPQIINFSSSVTIKWQARWKYYCSKRGISRSVGNISALLKIELTLSAGRWFSPWRPASLLWWEPRSQYRMLSIHSLVQLPSLKKRDVGRGRILMTSLVEWGQQHSQPHT